MVKCDRCGSGWDKEYISTIILFQPGIKVDVNKIGDQIYRSDIKRICDDCRNDLWNDIFA